MRWKKSHIVFIDIRWLFLKILVAIILVISIISYLKWNQVTIIEFKSTDLASSWQISNQETIKLITKTLAKSVPIKGERPRTGGFTFRLISQRQIKEYTFIETNKVFDSKKGQVLLIPDSLGKTLNSALNELKKRSPFGEMFEWESVKYLFPVGYEATVTDIDTKRKFSIKRTGGFNHADIEPATSRDSSIVQAIYSGNWSWKRRAVTLELADGRKIACSLVGMPQGKDQIINNNCNGSLGLYFVSRDMKRSINLSHMVMIWKAAGKTQEQLKGLSPEEIILVIFTALDQKDMVTLEKVVKPIKFYNRNKIKNILGVTIKDIRKLGKTTYNVRISLSMEKGPYNHIREVFINLLRKKEANIYYTNDKFLTELFK